MTANHPHRRLLRALFGAAVARAAPQALVPPHLPPPPAGRTLVLGAGKAAAAMALAVEEHMPDPLQGLVITRHGHGLPCRRVEVVEAAHPVPDADGETAARRMLALAERAGAGDLVLFLVSGGASALLSLPGPGVTLADKRAVTRALLRSGAPIAEMNCVRKHLSAIKGGRLAVAAAPARVLTLAISDVPGDDPAVIGSGPTVADPTTSEQAREILRRHRIPVPATLSDDGAETPKPGDPRLRLVETRVVATARASLEAAAETARAAGFRPRILGDAIEGEAREVARDHARLAREARPGTVLISGGETTVTVRGRGRGGRNAEYLLALAIECAGAPGIWAIACDTDGIDGTEDNAGCLLAPDTLARAAALGLDAPAMLEDNDAYGFFAALGDLVVTGPTRTNVNDFRAIIVDLF